MKDNIFQERAGDHASTPAWQALFAPLSEQRRLPQKAASFLRTHNPQILEGKHGLIHEDILVHQMLASPLFPSSNRVWFVAGGSGAGKSELLEWLSLSFQMQAPLRHQFLLHIHAYEANPLRIATSLKAFAPDYIHLQEQKVRWEEARHKPQLFAKILLLQTLDQLTQSDEESYALYYNLANSVNDQLQDFLEASDEGGSMEMFELFSSAVWNSFREETSLSLPFSYQAFHQVFQASFQHYLFAGLSLPALMSSVSVALQQQGVRPILLIDDVIGSLHLFAPDLLNMLLFAPGTWDVVCGITPQNENQSVANFFDRLAASVGAQGYYHLVPLDEQQCVNLAYAYLREYQRIQGSDVGGLSLFNRETLVRLLRGLPDHRRTPRAFLHYLEILLAQESKEAFLAQLWQLTAHEYMVQSTDTHLARLGEIYGPLAEAPVETIHLAARVFFDLPPQDICLPVEPLLTPDGQQDRQKLALFEWMGMREETGAVALMQLCKGAARLLQETIAPEVLGVVEGSRHSFLRWKKAYKEVSPPILLAGEWRSVDVSGIPLDWETSTLAYDLARYATSSGAEQRL